MNKPGSSKHQLAERIKYVQECMLNDYDSALIKKSVIEKYNVCERQAYRYLWAARKFFEAKDQDSIERKRAFYLERKRRLIRSMDEKEKKTAAGVRVINTVLDSMAQIEGVSMNTIKLIGDKDQPIATISTVIAPPVSIDYSKLPTELLEWVVSNRKAQNV